MCRSTLVVALACVWLSAASHAVWAQDYNDRALSTDELQRLAKGELVTRPMRSERGELRLFGGSSWQVIDALPEVVWAALHDTPRYPHMLPRVLQASVVAKRDHEQDLFIYQGSWPIYTSYYLTLRSNAVERSIDFKLDDSRPHGIRAGWGLVRLRAYGSGRTLMALGILADVGHGVLAWFTRALVQRWMLKIPSTVKAFLESGGRDRYTTRAAVAR